MDLILCVGFGAWGELEKSKHFKGRRMKIYALINKNKPGIFNGDKKTVKVLSILKTKVIFLYEKSE